MSGPGSCGSLRVEVLELPALLAMPLMLLAGWEWGVGKLVVLARDTGEKRSLTTPPLFCCSGPEPWPAPNLGVFFSLLSLASFHAPTVPSCLSTCLAGADSFSATEETMLGGSFPVGLGMTLSSAWTFQQFRNLHG